MDEDLEVIEPAVQSTSAPIWKSPQVELDEDEREYNRMVTESCSLNTSFSQGTSQQSPTLATQEDLAGTCGQPIEYASSSSVEAHTTYRMENPAARNGQDARYQRSLEQQQLLRMATESALQESFSRAQANWHQDAAHCAQVPQPAQASTSQAANPMMEFAPAVMLPNQDPPSPSRLHSIIFR